MSSEIIVGLVLIASAVGFIIWVRMHSHAHDHEPQGDHAGPDSRPADKC